MGRIRAAGYANSIAVIPNGVEIPREMVAKATAQQSQSRRALFLSRIHPKKGLLNLLEAWRQVHPVGWELLIVGPDEAGHLVEVKKAVRRHGLESQVRFPGEVWGEDRNHLYFDSDLFVLPTFSENFGLVFAEALSCGVPVITTHAAPRAARLVLAFPRRAFRLRFATCDWVLTRRR